jgi:VanZ family protein
VLNNAFILEIRLDYLVHCFIFIPWMILIWLLYNQNVKMPFLKILGWFLAGISLSVVSEGLQYFIPYRAFNINDLLANIAGVFIGAAIFFFKKPDWLKIRTKVVTK